MTEPAIVIPLTSADIAQYEAFHIAEMAADGKRPNIDEMIEVASWARDQLGRSMRAANTEYGAPFDAARMRRYVVLRYVIDLLERIGEHKGQVAPILYPEMVAPAPRRAKRA